MGYRITRYRYHLVSAKFLASGFIVDIDLPIIKYPPQGKYGKI